ncbi:MAG: hypothetical protein GF350_08110, partial [Chitinivibrionales bacterium]|nr:hypothetical protein [Chitinivibrionales bacterium]
MNFIQVHYHNRTGGVFKVMKHYAAAFRACRNEPGDRNIIMCSVDPSLVTGKCAAELYHIPHCDYHSFRSEDAFYRIRKRLVDCLENSIKTGTGEHPVYVVGHNMSLGKNCALTSAFTHCVKKYRRNKSAVRFVSVIHDLAEEGRTAQLDEIARICRFRKCFERELYPDYGNIRYIALNMRTSGVLKAAGLPVEMLPNPVRVRRLPDFPGSKWKVHMDDALCALAARDNTRFDPGQQTVLYPVRILGRKNIYEALMVSCVFMGANLIAGGPGKTGRDTKLFAEIKNFCIEKKLNAVFDINRIHELLPRSMKKFPVFPLCMTFADSCITTAVAEGFGYALYEPWLYDKAVCGRKACGMTPPDGFLTSTLYERLPVPIEWIDIERVRHKYYTILSRYYMQHSGISFPQFADYFDARCISRKMIDFAACDYHAQTVVLRRILDNPESACVVFNRAGGALQDIFDHKAHGPEFISTNKRIIESRLSYPAFIQSFKKNIISD